MSAKNNAVLAGSGLIFIFIFVGGIIGLLFLAVWITRRSDSNKKDSFTVSANDNKRINKDQLARQKNQQAGVPKAPR